MDTLELPSRAARPPARPPEPPERRRLRPHARPPLALRALIGLTAVAVVVGIVALMLSDRAPGALHSVLGDLADRWSARIDARRPSTSGQLPPGDVVVHVGAWAVATVLLGWTVWAWRWLLLALPAVFGLSIVVELGQGRWTRTRAVELSDLAANARGVAAGGALVACCYVVWSTLATAARRLRRR